MKGYLLYAQGETHVKYAIELAKSLQDELPISLVTDKQITSDLFDKVIYVEKNKDKFHVKNRSLLWSLSPYEETTVIESDCLVTCSMDRWWNKNKDKDLTFISKAFNYRQEPSNTIYDRKTFVKNDLPNLYVACYYFKKTEFTKTFWDLVYKINTNKEFYIQFLKDVNPEVPSMDRGICLAAKLLNCFDKVAYTGDDPMFVHMKPYGQGFEKPAETWSSILGFYRTQKELFIGNYKQNGIIHYIEDVI
jgi:hypothetical protein